MPDVIAPAAFNERFTLYLNTAGKPVQRTLREMTADEVMLAIEWHEIEAERLERDAAPAIALATAAAEGTLDPATPDEAVEATVCALQEAGDARLKVAQLLVLVRTAMPQWQGSGMPLKQALRRWWPGGRAA